MEQEQVLPPAFDPVKMVRQAADRIWPFVRQTLLEPSLYYSQQTGADVHFKCENLQYTGSFKVRGALNKILSLSPAVRDRGIVTASTGNHGAACAFALRQVGAKGIVFVPENAVETKLAAIRRLGTEIRTFGSDSVETETHARQFAEARDMTYVPPYNDPLVIGGQGTIGVELQQQLPELDAVFVSVGGGGLMGGVASYLKAVRPAVRVVGCSPENSQVMVKSVAAGKLLDLPSLPTLSDGTAGGIEANAITFPLCRAYVDQYVTVNEAEIAASLRQFMEAQHMMIEGSAAVALAAFLKVAEQFKNQRVVVVLCGANISLETLRQILAI
jgi:threonine dehydratase